MKTFYQWILSVLLIILVTGCQSLSAGSQPRAEASPASVLEKPVVQTAAPAKAASSLLRPEENKKQLIPGTSLTATLGVQNAPSGVRAMGYEIWFNPAVLKFEKYERTGLMNKGFAMFGANVVKPGKLRMGGIEAGITPLATGANGDLFILHFKVIGQGTPDFGFRNFKDDIQDWPSLVSSCDAEDGFSGMVLCPGQTL
ncbi:MAG: hypothetical protein JEZ02_14280 [Desulfatibacillum sp.]|nr:hypothetical protein [Desulfatibacillum sp.]